jgi:hypothetical protein
MNPAFYSLTPRRPKKPFPGKDILFVTNSLFKYEGEKKKKGVAGRHPATPLV